MIKHLVVIVKVEFQAEPPMELLKIHPYFGWTAWAGFPCGLMIIHYFIK